MYGSSPSDPSHIPTKTDPPCFTFPPHTSGRTKSNKIRVTFATKKIYTPGRQKKSIPSGTRGLGGGNLSYATPKMAQQPARALPYDDPKIAQKRFGDGSDPFASSEVFRTHSICRKIRQKCIQKQVNSASNLAIRNGKRAKIASSSSRRASSVAPASTGEEIERRITRVWTEREREK
jgi:hypothetical protein